ncbi:MAG TPA: hypothetical protein VKR05_02520, partial [Candidatus Cybelea sp.]|nr:hypothetical protein [Candidatus Cybelea sp.]
DDLRSYRIDSTLIARELGFTPTRSVGDAVRDLCEAFDRGAIPDSMTDPRYFNIKTMQLVGLR